MQGFGVQKNTETVSTYGFLKRFSKWPNLNKNLKMTLKTSSMSKGTKAKSCGIPFVVIFGMIVVSLNNLN